MDDFITPWSETQKRIFAYAPELAKKLDKVAASNQNYFAIKLNMLMAHPFYRKEKLFQIDF